MCPMEVLIDLDLDLQLHNIFWLIGAIYIKETSFGFLFWLVNDWDIFLVFVP